jgi:nucleolar protein 56
MKAYIVTTFLGCFGVDEKSEIVAFKPFPKNAEEVAKRLITSQTKLIDEERSLMEELSSKGFDDFIFQKEKGGFKGEPDNSATRFILQNLRDIAIGKKIFKDQQDFNKFLIDVNVHMTKFKIKESIGQDKLIVQAVSAIDEIDKSLNVFMERLREMYSLHFPEMDKAVASHERYAKLVAEYGSRKNIKEPNLQKLAENSVGMEITKDDVDMLKNFSKHILDLYSLREELVKYIEETTNRIAPNTSEIAGAMLTARLMAKAGGIEKLAKATSSTIQLLGAEKSLFRFLHGKGKSPRFGILATHPLVQSAPEKLKGRIARAIASKLSIAAKIDYYSKEYRGDKMKKELQERVKEILSKK